jgi:hypothetical protein
MEQVRTARADRVADFPGVLNDSLTWPCGAGGAQQGLFWEYNEAIFTTSSRRTTRTSRRKALTALAERVGDPDLEAFAADHGTRSSAPRSRRIFDGPSRCTASLPAAVPDQRPYVGGALPLEDFQPLSSRSTAALRPGRGALGPAAVLLSPAAVLRGPARRPHHSGRRNSTRSRPACRRRHGLRNAEDLRSRPRRGAVDRLGRDHPGRALAGQPRASTGLRFSFTTWWRNTAHTCPPQHGVDGPPPGRPHVHGAPCPCRTPGRRRPDCTRGPWPGLRAQRLEHAIDVPGIISLTC